VAASRPLAHRLLWSFGVRGLVVLVLLAAAALTMAQPAPPAPSADCIVLADLGRARVGAFPDDWTVRSDEGRQVYTVREDGHRRLLRAVSSGLGIQAARQTDGWDLSTHPVLAWSWRPREFPRGADERAVATNDSALAVYLLVPYSTVRGPRAVKYIWSERVPVGTRLSSNQGLTQVLVLRSGRPASGDGWVEERVNALTDWRAAFQESGTPKPAGIAVLTDADDTRSTAAGDYADFRACRS
jgi:hypothetical protein